MGDFEAMPVRSKINVVVKREEGSLGEPLRSLITEKPGDSIITKIAIMDAKKALQRVHLLRWVDCTFRVKSQTVTSYRAKHWPLKHGRAMLPFHGGAAVNRKVD